MFPRLLLHSVQKRKSSFPEDFGPNTYKHMLVYVVDFFVGDVYILEIMFGTFALTF